MPELTPVPRRQIRVGKAAASGVRIRPVNDVRPALMAAEH
jgi:hypothetical protein